MKFGVCAGPDSLPIAVAAGCDYMEAGFSATASMEEDAFRAFRDAVLASPIRVEAMNGFLPGTMRLTGENADHAAPVSLYEKGFARAKELGCRVVVFGSGGARQVPEGFPMDRAEKQLAAFAAQASACAESYGIRLALEPLRTAECNILHTVKEALAIRRLAGEPENLYVLGDLFHMHANGEDFSGILEAGSRLAHCHIAAPVTRLFCAPGEADDYYKAFFDSLRTIGYEGRISLEGGCKDLATDLAPSIRFLRSL